MVLCKVKSILLNILSSFLNLNKKNDLGASYTAVTKYGTFHGQYVWKFSEDFMYIISCNIINFFRHFPLSRVPKVGNPYRY